MPRVRTRAFTVLHADGSKTRVMQQQKQATPRVLVTLRVAVDGVGPDNLVRLSVGELEDIIRTIRELADGYEIVSRQQASGPPTPSRPPGATGA